MALQLDMLDASLPTRFSVNLTTAKAMFAVRNKNETNPEWYWDFGDVLIRLQDDAQKMNKKIGDIQLEIGICDTDFYDYSRLRKRLSRDFVMSFDTYTAAHDYNERDRLGRAHPTDHAGFVGYVWTFRNSKGKERVYVGEGVNPGRLRAHFSGRDSHTDAPMKGEFDGGYVLEVIFFPSKGHAKKWQDKKIVEMSARSDIVLLNMVGNEQKVE